MVYTKRTPWVLIIGLLMAGFALLVKMSVGADFKLLENGLITPMLKYLGSGSKAKEIIYMGFICGGIGIVVGLWQLIIGGREGHGDYYLSTVGGVLFILLFVFLIKYGMEPVMKKWGEASQEAINWDWAHTLGVNYILLGIITGIIIVNVFKVPAWAENGVRLSRLGLKSGVILLGALYSGAELLKYSTWAIGLIFFFVLGSVGITLFMGRRKQLPNSMCGVMAAGLGVCGVSATVAAAPVVNAKTSEIAYTIGTILLWGVLMMFVFPPIGRAFDMTPLEFGAWAGTGILNSAQVAAAALIYQPDDIETLKVAEIYNITRILVLPLIVLWLAVWYVKREQTGLKTNVGAVIFSKFPLFVLGFMFVFALTTLNKFSPTNYSNHKFFVGKDSKKALSDKEIDVLKTQLPKVVYKDKSGTDDKKSVARKAAVERLIANKKIEAKKDTDMIKVLSLDKVHISKPARKIFDTAVKNASVEAPRIVWFRDFIFWFFAFGLTGLGMQITFKSIAQAGGQPLVIGTVVGTIKAVGALIAVLLLSKFGLLSN